MISDLTEPIAAIFNELEDLQDFGIGVQNDYSDTQTHNLSSLQFKLQKILGNLSMISDYGMLNYKLINMG